MTLEVKNLNVAYGEREILNDISFKLTDGQIIGLVAPNGTGKTTLFNAIMRFIPVKSGQIFVDDKEYTSSDKDILKLHQLITFFQISLICMRISVEQSISRCTQKCGQGIKVMLEV